MLSLAQQQALAIAPKFSSALSVVGSALICVLIWRSNRRRLYQQKAIRVHHDNNSVQSFATAGTAGTLKYRNPCTTYHRLLIGMSISDFVSSCAWFLTTWPVPYGTPGVFAAVGTELTCTAQGFFTQSSISTVFYNASLSVYYFLVIVRGWKDVDVVKIEPLLHLQAIAWGIGTSSTGLALDLFNSVGWDCWIGKKPPDCQESWTNGGVSTCERGDNATLFQWAFFYAPLWFAIVLVTILMYWVYSTVYRQEGRMKRYDNYHPSATAGVARASVTSQQSSTLGSPKHMLRKLSLQFIHCETNHAKNVERSEWHESAQRRQSNDHEPGSHSTLQGDQSLSARQDVEVEEMERLRPSGLPTCNQQMPPGQDSFGSATDQEAPPPPPPPPLVGDEAPSYQRHRDSNDGGSILSNSGVVTTSSTVRKRTSSRRYSRKIAGQALCYVGAFYFVWILPTVHRLMALAAPVPFWLICAETIVIPLQGCLNLVVFMRPKFKRYRKLHPDTKWSVMAWCMCLWSELTLPVDESLIPPTRSSRQHTRSSQNSMDPMGGGGMGHPGLQQSESVRNSFRDSALVMLARGHRQLSSLFLAADPIPEAILESSVNHNSGEWIGGGEDEKKEVANGNDGTYLHDDHHRFENSSILSYYDSEDDGSFGQRETPAAESEYSDDEQTRHSEIDKKREGEPLVLILDSDDDFRPFELEDSSAPLDKDFALISEHHDNDQEPNCQEGGHALTDNAAEMTRNNSGVADLPAEVAPTPSVAPREEMR